MTRGEFDANVLIVCAKAELTATLFSCRISLNNVVHYEVGSGGASPSSPILHCVVYVCCDMNCMFKSSNR